MTGHAKSPPPDPEKTELATVATLACGGGSCPTIYRAGDGTYVVQGRAVDPAAAGIALAADEVLVAVPEALVARLLEAGRQAG
ncbi:hypothetical protein [Asanoa sp. NPDC050611]|uniref:hypothetical protein n=1 Tax=Asanoa sp. NPDC050611 TaxID=3157098 RepID=UPI0033C0DF46